MWCTQGLSEEALQALLASIEEMGEAAEQLFSEAAAAAEHAAAPLCRAAGRAPRGRGCRGASKSMARTRRAAHDDGSSEDEVQNPTTTVYN